MRIPKWITIDFETKKIEPRPKYAPEPVGVAIKLWGKKSRYFAWGHPTKNNCTKEEGHARVREAINGSDPLLFQESKFDVEVAVEHVPGCRLPEWRRIFDTKFMLFLRNPHAMSLQLKPSAEEYLGWPPEERDELKEWILKNIKGATKSTWGEFICLAPGDLVGRYACGDVDRTDGLGKHLLPYISEHEMMDAMYREMRLMPILLENEQEGIRTDLDSLVPGIERMDADILTCDNYLRKRLKKPSLNIDSDEEFADALTAAKIVAEEDWALTKTGRRSVSKKNLLPGMFRDQKVFQAYSHRNKLMTCVNTFAVPWRDQALATGGTIHTTHRQVKGGAGNDDGGGARSGRKQTTPNFQNIPKNFNKKDPNYSKPVHLDVLDLPFMRRYLLPDVGHVWGRRDYNQQELRILAHFEDGSLLASYLEDPRYDMHYLVQHGVHEIVGILMERDPIKAFNFQDIYGGGIPAFCASLGCDEATARKVKAAKRELMPDVAELEKAIKDIGKSGEAIRTWGGREYYVEPAKYVEKFKRFTSFEYKLLNYLIQGSAADCTKEALIRYHEHPKRRGRILIDVHDEINVSAPEKVFKQEMALLREVMQSVEFDVPMLSDGEFGPSWGNLQKFEEPLFDLKKWSAMRKAA